MMVLRTVDEVVIRVWLPVSLCFMTFVQMEAVKEVLWVCACVGVCVCMCVSSSPEGSYIIQSQTLKM